MRNDFHLNLFCTGGHFKVCEANILSWIHSTIKLGGGYEETSNSCLISFSQERFLTRDHVTKIHLLNGAGHTFSCCAKTKL